MKQSRGLNGDLKTKQKKKKKKNTSSAASDVSLNCLCRSVCPKSKGKQGFRTLISLVPAALDQREYVHLIGTTKLSYPNGLLKYTVRRERRFWILKVPITTAADDIWIFLKEVSLDNSCESIHMKCQDISLKKNSKKNVNVVYYKIRLTL